MSLFDDFEYTDGVFSWRDVSVDTGLGDEPEAEVVYLQEPPQSFPWEWIAAGGFALVLIFAMRR